MLDDPLEAIKEGWFHEKFAEDQLQEITSLKMTVPYKLPSKYCSYPY